MRDHWLTRALNVGTTMGRVAELASSEVAFRGRLPLKDRLRLWRHGFLSLSGTLYGPSEAANGEYLSDYARFVQTPRINGRYGRMLDNKLAFTYMMEHLRPGTVPRLLGTTSRGIVTAFDPSGDARVCRSADELLGSRTAIVVKPVDGSLGKGILFLGRGPNGAIVVNGQRVSDAEAARGLRRCNAHIVTEFVRQAEYARAIQPGTTNTVRLLTLRCPETGDVIVPVAVHRFGTRRSETVDTWHGGGLGASVDLGTGTLGPAVGSPQGLGADWLSHHPDTGARIEGVRLPGWKDLLAEVVGLAERLPFLPYVGWDVVVTDDGFRVLEGNNRTDIDFLQVHTPLLRDRRVRRFYEHHGVRLPRSSAAR